MRIRPLTAILFVLNSLISFLCSVASFASPVMLVKIVGILGLATNLACLSVITYVGLGWEDTNDDV